MGAARRNGREQSNSNNNNNFLSVPRDSDEASAKGGSREESWVGALAPFVSYAACLGISLQIVPRSETLESTHGWCA